MTFNAGKYEATSTNLEKTQWSVESFDGKESFTLTEKRAGEIAGLLRRRTYEQWLQKSKEDI